MMRRGWWWRRRRAADLSCHDVARILQDYLDLELDESSAAGVTAHLEDCRRCGLEAEVYAAIKDAIARRDDRIPDDARRRVRLFAEQLIAGDR